MGKLVFEAEDFLSCNGLPMGSACVNAAKIANAKLDQWLSEQKVVHSYGTQYLWRDPSKTGDTVDYQENQETHRARLVCIEELPKKECEHESAVVHKDIHGLHGFHCQCCGKNIRPKGGWEVVE